VVAKAPPLTAAMGRYTVLQLQAQDLASALQNGWNRYGSILADAQAAGLLPENAFDSARQTWTLDEPVTNRLALAITEPSAVPPEAASTTTSVEPTTETAAAEPAGGTPSPVGLGLSTPPGVSALTAEPATLVPEPQLSGTPHPADEGPEI